MKPLSIDNFAEHIACESEQRRIMRDRKKVFRERSVNKKEFSGAPDEGWIIAKELKTRIKLQKPKGRDEIFEDRIWQIFSRMGFKFLSKSRGCVISYGSGEGETQQVDVLAVDDEVAVVVECKAADTEMPKKANFKTEIEAFVGKREAFIRAIREIFGKPDLKVAFVFATSNYQLPNNDLSRMDESAVRHFGDAEAGYYEELTAHLGRAARFQLEADLFPGQGIPGIDNLVHAVKAKMGGHVYYTFCIEPNRLLKIGYVLHRTKSIRLMPTYQRIIKKSRLRSVQRFVENGGFFPNSLIVNIEKDRKPPKFEVSEQKCGESQTQSGVLHLPRKYRSAYIIDGQHRLYGFSDSNLADSELIPVVAFVGLERSEQLRIFMEINENQTAVSTNLRHTLDADLKFDSSNLREMAEGLKKMVAQYLGEDIKSPLNGRVIIGEDSSTGLRIITLDSIFKGLNKTRFVGRYTTNEVKDPGFFYTGSNESALKRISKFLYMAFSYIESNAPGEWGRLQKERGFVVTPDGVHALIAVFGDILEHLVADKTLPSSGLGVEAAYTEAEPYLAALCSYLASVPQDDREDIRSRSGSGAPVRLRRILQRAIHSEFDSFDPDGLASYWRDQSKQFNMAAFGQVMDIELFLNDKIKEILIGRYKHMWEKSGIPPKVYDEAHSLMGKKNREIENPDDERELWGCLHLVQYREILSYKDHWSNLFQKDFTIPGTEGKKKEERTKWIVNLNEIRNKLDHEYSISQEEYLFVEAIHGWLIDGISDKVKKFADLT